jgi:galactokinase
MEKIDLSQFPYIAEAPGRVNLLGEHVDYNDGPVLPAAINRTVKLYFRPKKEPMVTLTAIDFNYEQAHFNLDQFNSIDLDQKVSLPGWAVYPAGVAWSLKQIGLPIGGIDGVITSDLSIGSGLSSSAALEMAFAAAWNFLAGNPLPTMDLVKAAKRAENQYVGVNCGIMDQFASGMGREGHALLLDTRSLDWQSLPLPKKTVIIIADSKLPRSLNTSAYNDRRADCEKAVQIISNQIPGIRALRDVTSQQYLSFMHLIPPRADIHARHVVEECERVDQAIPLLMKGDAVGFGQLMFACHNSLRDLYEVSLPELDTLVEIASRIPGCFGARLTGAGFGGCTVNLVEETQSESFIRALKTGYQKATGRTANIFTCKPSDGVRVRPNQ